MKLLFALFSLLLISSCYTNKKMQPEEFKNIRLHDIWALEKINGKNQDTNLTHQRPYFEIHLKSKKIYGNNGCNEFEGNISSLDNERISWSEVSPIETKCSNFEAVNQFHSLFLTTQYYRLDGLKLFFLNKKKKIIFQFKKVD